MDAPVQHVQNHHPFTVAPAPGKTLVLDRAAAKRHLEALAPGEQHFTFQTFDDDNERKTPGLAKIFHGTLAEHADALERLNRQGAGVYVMVNAGDGKGRKKANVDSVRALFIDTDGAPLPENPPLEPSVVVGSSPGKWHVYWRVVDVPTEDFEALQKGLAARYETDPVVCDLPRVMRLAGTYHRKAEPAMAKVLSVNPEALYTAKEVDAAWPGLSTPPEKAAEAATRKPAGVKSPVAPRDYRGDTPATEIVRKKLAALCERVAQTEEGGRNEAVKNAARTVGGYVAHGDILEVEVRPALEEAARKCGLSAAEAAQAVTNGLTNGLTLPLEVDLLEYRQTDYGAAERLWALYGREFRYSPSLGFLVWDGRRWAPDAEGRAVKRLAVKAARELSARAAAIADDEPHNRAEWIKHALQCERAVALKNVLENVKSIVSVEVDVADLDADPMRLNVENGTIDLRTGRLEPHNPDHLITKLAPVAYDPAARCPRWLAFQRAVCAGDEDLVRFKQRAFGYALTGETREHALFVQWGHGSNGKSTEQRTVARLLGDYATTAQFDTFAVRKSEGIRNDLADLMGARFVSASEGESGQRLAEGLVKQLTGGDDIKARFLHKEFFVYRPAFKAFLATNHKPVIRGTDEGIWRRIKLVPYAVTFKDGEKDPKLPEKLAAEASGVLNWLLEGCLLWQQHGLGSAAAVSAATHTYRAESDALADFIEARCAVDELYSEPAGALYAAYREYAEGNGDTAFTNALFGKMLSERGFGAKTSRGKNGKVARVRTGICLAEHAEGGA